MLDWPNTESELLYLSQLFLSQLYLSQLSILIR